jgi:hypothetical protein
MFLCLHMSVSYIYCIYYVYLYLVNVIYVFFHPHPTPFFHLSAECFFACLHISRLSFDICTVCGSPPCPYALFETSIRAVQNSKFVIHMCMCVCDWVCVFLTFNYFSVLGCVNVFACLFAFVWSFLTYSLSSLPSRNCFFAPTPPLSLFHLCFFSHTRPLRQSALLIWHSVASTTTVTLPHVPGRRPGTSTGSDTAYRYCCRWTRVNAGDSNAVCVCMWECESVYVRADKLCVCGRSFVRVFLVVFARGCVW